jgi:alkylated DNA nucleotide flippase Atl1
MRTCSDTTVPCHRVIAAGGKLGGYGRDLFAKRALLLADGVIVSAGKIRNFQSVRLLASGSRRQARSLKPKA